MRKFKFKAMNLFDFSVWGTSALMMLGAICCCILIHKGKISPPPATFLILSVIFPLMFWMYTGKEGWSFAGNIGLSSAVASAWTISFYYIPRLMFLGKLKISFSKSHKYTIAASFLVLVYWLFTKDSFSAYVALQLSALIGYIPMVEMLMSGKNKDSLFFWTSIFLSALVAAYAAYQRSDLEAWIYIARALLSTGLVLYLMIRLQLKNKSGSIL